MSRLIIDGISKNFFKTETKKTENHQTNPFGVSFKGNVLAADVFEKKEETNLIERAKNKSKMLSSAAVGSITKFGSAIGERLNSVVSFGNRIKENVSNAWQQANNIEISLNWGEARNLLKTEISFSGKGLTFTENKYRVKNLQKCSVADLDAMLANELATV